MQSARSLAIYTSIIVIALLTQTGCKENTILNANVAPSVDNINAIQKELQVSCKTIYTDSIATSNSYSGISIIHGLGTVTDPYFGKTNAGIYFQVVPQSDGYIFPVFDHIDSTVLILPYSGFTFGDSALAINQTITAYQVTEDMSKDSIYYAFNTKAVNRSSPLGRATVNIDHLSDDVVVGSTNGDTSTVKGPHLRIKLDSSAFAGMLLSHATEISNQTTFLNLFKGIYLEADPRINGAAIPYFYLDGSSDYTRAGILVYYHAPGDTTVRTQPFFYTSSFCAHFNHVTRNMRGTSAEAVIRNPNSASALLLQNLPGCVMDVTISGIRNIPVNALVNKAQLVINRLTSTTTDETYASPYRIYPIGIDSTGATYTIADGYPITSTAALAFIDGTKRDPDGVSTYTHYLVNMPREIQAAIKAGKDSVHFHLTGTTDFPGAFRLVAGGNDNTAAAIHFNVVYTKN